MGNRGSIILSKTMQEILVSLQSQLRPFPTEAPSSLSANEQSHTFVYKAIYRLLLQSDYNKSPELSVLLSDVSYCLKYYLTYKQNPSALPKNWCDASSSWWISNSFSIVRQAASNDVGERRKILKSCTGYHSMHKQSPQEEHHRVNSVQY